MGYVVPKTTKKMKHHGVTFEVWQEESTSGYTSWKAWAVGIGPLASSDTGDGGSQGRASAIARAKAKIDARPGMAADQSAYVNDKGNWPGGVKPKEYHMNPRKRRPPVVKPVAHPAWSVMRSVYRPKKAKERNPTDAKAVSAIILAQLGGAGRVSTMLGRPTMGYGTSPEGPYLSIKFASPHRGPNYCKITLTPADTYTVEFAKLVKYDLKPVGTYHDVYAEQLKPLFERVSGLYLSLGTMGRSNPVKRNPVIRRHKTIAEMRAAGVPDYFEKIQKRGEVYRPSTMLYESGEQRPVAGHSGHFISSSGNALMHLRPVGSDPDDTEITVRGLYDAYGRRKNPASTVGHLLADVRAALPGWPIQPDNGRVIVIGARPEVARQRLVALGYNAKIVPANAYGEPAHVVVSASRSNPAKRRNPVPRASKAGPSGPRYGSGPERYYISDTTAQHHARHLAPMTDENDHAGARLYLARTVLASPTFEEKVKDGNARMDRSHTSAHYNDNEAAWKANHALLKRMLAQVKRRTTPAGYAAIHGAL